MYLEGGRNTDSSWIGLTGGFAVLVQFSPSETSILIFVRLRESFQKLLKGVSGSTTRTRFFSTRLFLLIVLALCRVGQNEQRNDKRDGPYSDGA